MMARAACYPLGALLIVCALVSSAAGDDPTESLPGSIHFSEHLLSGDHNYPYGVTATDLDGDGDLDLTNPDIRGKPSRSTLYWHENDGSGSFSRHTIHERELGWFERHDTGDINLDGKPDVAIVDNRDGELLWFANSIEPSKPAAWKRHVLSSNCPRAYNVILYDVDGDGDLDAAASAYLSNFFAWYENPGPGNWHREWTRRTIDDNMPEARTVRAADFNRDGRLDLLASSVGVATIPPSVTDWKVHGGSVVWYENTGDSNSRWKKHVIDDVGRAPIHGEPVDMDLDGDLDVVMATGMLDELLPSARHAVVWYEQLQRTDGSFLWLRHKVAPLPYAHDAVAGDLDGDGDVDVAATSWAKGNRVVWFENGGDPRERWTEHVLKENWPAANQLLIADLNGDGRPDIVASADDGSRRADGAREVRWWQNEGPARTR